MNRVELLGRLTKDPELKKTTSGLSVCQFTLAIGRPKRKDQEEAETDFISCVAWRQNADYITQYGQKGSTVAVEGKIQTRSYDDRDGRKVYVTEVVADALTVIRASGSSSPRTPAPTAGSMSKTDISKDIAQMDWAKELGAEEDLPF